MNLLKYKKNRFFYMGRGFLNQLHQPQVLLYNLFVLIKTNSMQHFGAKLS